MSTNRKTKEEKPVLAICYDFDKTLSPDDMQAQGYIQDVYEGDVGAFWNESNSMASENEMDNNLAYMYKMVQEAQGRIVFNKKALMDYGAKVALFPGVEGWFERIRQYGAEKDVIVEHYIISSGLKEMIEGTSVAKAGAFEKIYASSFMYNDRGVAVWPAQAINYTNKTQFLFRIEKGVLDINDDGVNDYFSPEKIRVPFRNIVYIGDSATDIPCMKLVNVYGGHSIGVYNDTTLDKTKVYKMLIFCSFYNIIISVLKFLRGILGDNMRIDGINFELNKENIRYNYYFLVDYIGDKIINGDVSELSIENNDLNNIIINLIEIINLKLQMGNELSRNEAEIFIYSLICYTLDSLEIDCKVSYDFVLADGEKLSENMNGICCQSKDLCIIYYNMNIINKFCNKNLDFHERVGCLSTICHELVHVRQYLDITNEVFSLDNFIISLETVLGLESFCKENYFYMRMELDAKNRGYDLLFDFYKMHDVYDSMVVDKFKECTKMISEYEFNQANNQKVYENGIELDSSIEEYLLSKVSKMVLEDNTLIDKYPLLSLVFNVNGEMFSVKELFENRIKKLRNCRDCFKINEIYEYIVSCYQVIMGRDSFFIDIVTYLEENNYMDVFALRMVEKMHEVKKNISGEELNSNIKKRILS